MAEKFQRLPVSARTQKQVKILAAVKGQDLNVLVGRLVDTVWQAALIDGLVNDAMLEVDEGMELPGQPVVYAQRIQE